MKDTFVDEKQKATNIVDIHNENIMERQAKILYNEKLESIANDLEADIQKRLKKSEEMEEKLKSLEIMPLTNYILARPFNKNPYVALKMKGNIVLEGYNGNFLNPDTGETDQEEQMIVVGTVIEVGPECKYVREGDDIFYTKNSLVPVPFFGKGFQLINENRVVVAINTGLKERFGMTDK